MCITICGDGIQTFDEECDDGNSQDGDGCSGECQIEDGWKCITGSAITGDFCFTVCGDGIIAGDEVCDDGNILPNDGCS